MRAKTLQINWHDCRPIFSADFDRHWEDQDDVSDDSRIEQHSTRSWRFATAGGDNNVRIWTLLSSEKQKEMKQVVQFRASLERHTASVNVVRFSPVDSTLATAGDDGSIIIWRQLPQDALGAFGGGDNQLLGEDSSADISIEVWKPASLLRGSLADIYDLAWSPDGRFIISGSIDNTARIWDVRSAKCIQVLTEHSHYVQGVCWDPKGKYIATQGSDRTLNVYQWRYNETKPGEPPAQHLAKQSRVHQPPANMILKTGQQPPTPTTKDDRQSNERETPPEMADAKGVSSNMFYGDNLATFFRRLCFTPDGKILIAPSGISKGSLQPDQNVGGTVVTNTAYLWSRDKLESGPIAHLPGHKKPVVVARCCPVALKHHHHNKRESANFNEEETIRCDFQSSSWVRAPYRTIFALASQDSIILYDTAPGKLLGEQDQQSNSTKIMKNNSSQFRAIAHLSGLHYASITDIAWSPDGRSLMVTSTDGFATLVSFDQNELGIISCMEQDVYGDEKKDTPVSCMATMAANTTSAEKENVDGCKTMLEPSREVSNSQESHLKEHHSTFELGDRKEEPETSNTKNTADGDGDGKLPSKKRRLAPTLLSNNI
ncbi:Chromatin assembly factor 1 subunit [Mycoemilia scoparia]|uniref:Chromatin assembly factor 1 subunit n=1 Tax=Mycoemilia scoparia TaxID=417184 RepID=A0A9W8A9N5_9FUNG|nr:Chromatin assembly factor 1 subunit [Mycoemilia scoparia]